MMYSSTLTLKLSVDMVDIASAIGRALDPDTGGAYSFSVDTGGTTISTSTPCTQEFADQAAYMITHPEVLHQAVLQDYATRWSEFTAPTLEECTLFCNSIVA